LPKLDDEQIRKIKAAISNAQSENVGPLAHIIGLSNVKKQIDDLKHFVITQEERRKFNLPMQNLNLHLVFTGNPGTGKTTIAREVAKIYKKFGLLKKGHLVETDRSGLVAEYLGQTAIKTKGIIDKAMDGILFIDEAYSLLGPGQGLDYGREAVDTLLKEMEDKKGRFAVIVADYPNEMENFVNSNPGLKSRFGKTINFEDYSHFELLQIFELFCLKENYDLSDKARTKLANYFVKLAPIGEKGFGNGRYVRNIFEDVIRDQSRRLSLNNISGVENLQKITEEDIDKLYANQ
jgi:SpoVK/Ycf46/Vps4 family AAA+-type ATPase